MILLFNCGGCEEWICFAPPLIAGREIATEFLLLLNARTNCYIWFKFINDFPNKYIFLQIQVFKNGFEFSFNKFNYAIGR